MLEKKYENPEFPSKPEEYLDSLGLKPKKEVSQFGLRPGDLILFDYEGSRRLGIILSSKRTSSGIFLSTRNNTLLNVLQLTSLSLTMFRIVVNNLYKKENRCKYHSRNILQVFSGKESFRTFNLAKTRNIRLI